MVHVGMGDESVAHAQELARGKDANITEVEEQRPTSEPEIDEEPRIRKRIVDQAGLHEKAQIIALLPSRRGPLAFTPAGAPVYNIAFAVEKSTGRPSDFPLRDPLVSAPSLGKSYFGPISEGKALTRHGAVNVESSIHAMPLTSIIIQEMGRWKMTLQSPAATWRRAQPQPL
jgi:hypothetical protein